MRCRRSSVANDAGFVVSIVTGGLRCAAIIEQPRCSPSYHLSALARLLPAPRVWSLLRWRTTPHLLLFYLKKYAAADVLFAPDFVFHAPVVPGGIRGAAAYREQVMVPLLAAFPDLHVRPDTFFTDGDAVIVAWTMQGTHRGPFQGMPPTGKPFSVPGIIIAHVAAGRIREIRGVFDGLNLLQQLGLLPPPQPASA